jgi:hypothetical protein
VSDDTPAEPIEKLAVDQHTNVLIYFRKIIEGYGVVEIKTWGHGLEVWVGGECRAKVDPPWVTDLRRK